MLTRRSLLQSLLAPRSERYNLLLVTADNLGYGDLGCYGNAQIHTPHFDRFAGSGTRFTNFYTASPTCTASRAGLLTGRHPVRYGLNYQLSAQENKGGIGLPHSETLIPQYLKPLGYTTACFGKWNLGWAPGSRPTERGFDEFFGHRSGNIDYYTHVYNGELDMYRGVEPARVEGYSTDLFAGEAISFLQRNRTRPFFLYLPFNAPHFPNPANARPGESNRWQAPDRWFAHYGYSPEEPDPVKRYRAVVTALDDAFGRVLQAVRDAGLERNTLVFFYSDNGAFMLPGRGLEVQSNRPLRGGGVSLWEGGIRVAGMARWPRRIPAGGTCAALLSAYDVLPLAAGLAGAAALPSGREFDGINPVESLRTGRGGHEHLFFEWEKQQAVRSGEWKLIRDTASAPWQLYKLSSDIGETEDVSSRSPQIAWRLASEFISWRRQFPQAAG